MKKLLLILIVFSVFPAVFYGAPSAEETYETVKNNTVINWESEPELLRSGLGFNIDIDSYSSLVKNSVGNIVRNSVQDVLGNKVYESFNKGYTRFDKIKIYPSNETAAVEAIVLFNLDIYSYYETGKDPLTDLDRRLEYSEKTFLSFPLILHIDLNKLESVLSEELGDKAEGKVYYFEPESPDSQSGKWYPFSHLKELGDIDYTIDKGIMTVIIYKWPKDDRVHVGG
ncbi:MAG: hypothetical protein KAH21_11470 [Spirochaetaceae bacterium]|nr:hypothetical protein [Spirochaetaceae bacterium]